MLGGIFHRMEGEEQNDPLKQTAQLHLKSNALHQSLVHIGDVLDAKILTATVHHHLRVVILRKVEEESLRRLLTPLRGAHKDVAIPVEQELRIHSRLYQCVVPEEHNLVIHLNSDSGVVVAIVIIIVNHLLISRHAALHHPLRLSLHPVSLDAHTRREDQAALALQTVTLNTSVQNRPVLQNPPPVDETTVLEGASRALRVLEEQHAVSIVQSLVETALVHHLLRRLVLDHSHRDVASHLL